MKIRILSILLLSVLFFCIVTRIDVSDFNNQSKEYYIENTYEEVGSKNIVTGIYLDYRLFDSIFEAGILLVSVAGVIFMSKKDETMFKGGENERE